MKEEIKKEKLDLSILDDLKNSLQGLQIVLEKKLEEEELKILKLQEELPELIRLSKMMNEIE